MGRKKEKSDEEILATARACFIEYGPAVATGVIAKELGVSQATLFNRFNTKKELMFAALGPPENSRLSEILKSPPDARPIRDQLLEIGDAALDYFNDTDPRMAVLKASGITGDQLIQRYHVLPQELCRIQFSRWVARAQSSGNMREVDAEHFALAFMGALKSGLDHTIADNNVERIQQYITGVVDIFWSAVDPAHG